MVGERGVDFLFRPAVCSQNSNQRLVRDAGSQRFLDKFGDPLVLAHRQVLHHIQ
jgi:hypothetical protein